MSQPDADPQHLTMSDREVARRGFLKQVTAALGSFLLWRTGGPVLRDNEMFAREPATLTSLENSTSSYLPAAYQGYPRPTYLPKDYQLMEVFSDQPGGFGSDSDELAFWYVNPKHPLGFNSPLSVYVTQQPQRTALGATEHHNSTSVLLSTPSDASVQAEYHDGFWVLSLDVSSPLTNEHIMLRDGDGILIWRTTNFHSLTFRLREFTIGVRGARLTGVNYGELIRVASSIA
jgi:hypothetical protein